MLYDFPIRHIRVIDAIQPGISFKIHDDSSATAPRSRARVIVPGDQHAGVVNAIIICTENSGQII
jgi:hypothetical protein